MKKILPIALLCAMLLSSCASNAAADGNSAGETPVSQEDASVTGDATAPASGPGRGFPSDENRVTGKVTAVSEGEITLELAKTNMPQRPGNGERPEGSRADMTEFSGERPEGGSRPEGMGGGRGFSSENLEYTGETGVYTVLPAVEIRKNIAAEGGSLAISDIAADDVVMLTLDDSGQVASIMVMD